MVGLMASVDISGRHKVLFMKVIFEMDFDMEKGNGKKGKQSTVVDTAKD